ncbi:hypothetical protein OUZ56_004585 [Daphnia magna]|uniref:Uncharacterized protein n=1 Tax=Daphnia magna TaxID=35525 RepID=A0ABQ9YQ79_9CRUS|nr:hypothetical protein OUZ56_004585 [Daphnia magna]
MEPYTIKYESHVPRLNLPNLKKTDDALAIPVAEDDVSYFILCPEHWQDPKKINDTDVCGYP